MYESIFIMLGRIKKQIIQQYRAKGLKASGSFENNITIGRQGRYKVTLTLPYYSEFIMKFKSNKGGVKPGGRFPNIDAIKQWVKDKGLQLRDYTSGRFVAKTETNYKKAAYLIGRKIQREGTDIYRNKRQPIDLDAIVDDGLDYAGNEIADRILQDFKIEK